MKGIPVILVAAIFASVPGFSSGNDRVEKVDALVAGLASLSMTEKVSRYASFGQRNRKLDELEADVAIADGVELYSNVRRGSRSLGNVPRVVGLWSFGEIVTMLRTTRNILAAASDIPTDTETLHFRCPAERRQWFLDLDGQVYWLGFEGSLRFSEGALRQLTWVAPSPASSSGIARVEWDVTFQEAQVAGREYTAPSESIFRLTRGRRDLAVEWNLTRYVPIGRFGSSTSIRFNR